MLGVQGARLSRVLAEGVQASDDSASEVAGAERRRHRHRTKRGRPVVEVLGRQLPGQDLQAALAGSMTTTHARCRARSPVRPAADGRTRAGLRREHRRTPRSQAALGMGLRDARVRWRRPGCPRTPHQRALQPPPSATLVAVAASSRRSATDPHWLGPPVQAGTVLRAIHPRRGVNQQGDDGEDRSGSSTNQPRISRVDMASR